MSECIDYGAEARARHDVALLDGEAHFMRPLGRLVVTESQREKARLTHDPLFPVADYIYLGTYGKDEDPSKAWLDENIHDAWQAAYPDDTIRVSQALWRSNIRTARDLIVMGRHRTSGIPNFGEKTMTQINDFLQKKNYPLAWKDEPTVVDIAAICDSLDEIPGVAIIPPSRFLPLGMSVKGILETPAEKRQGELGAYNTFDDYVQKIYADEAYGAAEIFAIRFDLVKNGRDEDYWYKEF